MKIKSAVTLLLTLSTIGLVSCGENKETPSSTNPSSIAQDYVAIDSIEGLMDTFSILGESANFTLYNDYNVTTYEYSKNFYRNSDMGITYVNLPAHKGEKRNIAYAVSYLANGTPFISSMAYTTDIYGNRYEIPFDSFNYFKDATKSLATSSFLKENGVYVTEADSILNSFNNLYGISSIGKASFWFDSGNKVLNFELFGSDNNTLTNGTISHIQNTKDAALDEFVENFSWDKAGKALTKEQAGPMFDVQSSSTTNVYKTNGESKLRIAEMNFKCNEDTLSIHAINDPDKTKNEYFTYIKEDKETGRAIAYGLNAQNEETSEETRYFFSEYDLPAALDPEDFRLCGDGKYRYLSLEPNLVYQTYAHISINDENCSFEDVTLTLKDNKVTAINMRSEISAVASYDAITTFNTYEEIKLPSPYVEEGPQEWTRAMSQFDGTKAFKVTRANSLTKPTSKTTYTFDGTTYVTEDSRYNGNTNAWETSVTGYTILKDGTILPFRKIKGKNKLVQSDDVMPNDKIASHFPKLVANATLKKTSNGVYQFRELITEALNTLWLPSNVLPSSVSFVTNRQGLLQSAAYEVLYSSDSKGYLSFEYSNITLPEGLDLDNIGPMELTCYEDDSPDEWSDLVNYIGQKYADMIPYYFDKKYVGNWYAEPRYASGTGVPDKDENGQVNYDDPYIGVGLYLAGSKTPTNVLDEGFKKNGFTKVTSGLIDVGYRDDDYKANGYDSDVYLIDASKQTVWLSADQKLRVIYDSDIAFYHFNPSIGANYVLGSGLLIEFTDGTPINRTGTFH